MTPRGLAVGCVGAERAAAFRAKATAFEAARNRLGSLTVTPAAALAQGLRVNQDGQLRTALDLLAYPDVTVARLAAIWPELASLRSDVAEQLEIEARYRGYLDRQAGEVAAFRREEAMRFPEALDYGTLSGLSGELRQALERVRPSTLGAAARIPGMTPAALTLLYRHVRKAA